ncbi:MAG: T9SS type A sorting domain-containing protein [Bacteroidota bacterium]
MIHKKLFQVLAIATFVFSSINTNAQLRVENAQGEAFQDGDEFVFEETGEIGSEIGKLPFYVFNESTDENIVVQVEIQEIRNSDGSQVVFCMQPLCIFSVIEGESYPNNGAVIEPESYNSLDDYFINSDEGDEETTTIEYDLRFYATDEAGNDLNDLVITYIYDKTLSNLAFDLPSLGVDIYNTLVKNNFTFEAADSFELNIYDLRGKLIKTQLVTQGISQINLSDLSRGVYIAKFLGKKGSSSIKLIKE